MSHLKRFLRGTKCSQIFGLAQKIWTGTKHFGTCKRTRQNWMQSSILICHIVYLAKTHTEAQNRFLDFSLSVTTWPVSRGVGRVPPHYKNSHCRYVNIYISWKRKVNFNSLVWKLRSIILTFLLLSNSLLFAHCCCYSKKVEIFELHFYVKSTVNISGQ